MREPFVFDPRHPLCKTPFGAAVCGSQIALRCRPLAAEGFTHCALILQQEFSGLRQELKASFSGIEGDRACFALDFSAPAEPELVWYAFRLWRYAGQDRLPQRRRVGPLAADRLPEELFPNVVWPGHHLSDLPGSLLPAGGSLSGGTCG